jgi:hypothetical protein
MQRSGVPTVNAGIVAVFSGYHASSTGGGDDQCCGGDGVDAAGDTGRGVKDCLDGAVIEDRVFLRPGSSQTHGNVLAGFFERERREPGDSGDALIESAVGRFGQSILDGRLTAEKQ